MVRRFLDAWSPTSTVVPHRVAHCFLRTAAVGTIGLCAVYPKDGIGMVNSNLQLFRTFGAHALAAGAPFIAADDWNCTPGALRAAVDLNIISATIRSGVHVHSHVYTKDGETRSNTLDYSILSCTLSVVASDPRVDLA
eukprot:1488364-Pyramimonas_sp.AAC.1